eukprot:927707-Pleurochrysis_carterae.AAC.2
MTPSRTLFRGHEDALLAGGSSPGCGASRTRVQRARECVRAGVRARVCVCAGVRTRVLPCVTARVVNWFGGWERACVRDGFACAFVRTHRPKRAHRESCRYLRPLALLLGVAH